MSALLELQRGFQARLLERAEAAGPAGLASLGVVVPANGDISERVRIYEHAYLSRLVEALGRTYAVLRTVLGTAAFDELATAFVRATPSRHRSIRDYGGELSAFVRRSKRGVDAETCSELAVWEWLLADVFDAAGAAAVTVAGIASIAPCDWAALRFRAHPTLRRCTTTTNAVELWKRVSSAGLTPQAQPADELASCMRHGPVEWVAWRRDLTTQYRSLDAVEARALDAVSSGVSLGEVCESLAATHDADQAPLRAAQYLRGWIEGGLLAAI